MLGDGTSHGGTVVEASQVTFTHNKPIARVGDKVTCPIPGHGTTVIVEGDPTMILDGKPVARHGDKCACGAVLISSQVVSSIGAGGGGSAGATTPKANQTSPSPTETAPTTPLSSSTVDQGNAEEATYDHRFLLSCSLTGVPLAKQPYRLIFGDKTVEGETDANGMTQSIDTSSASGEVVCEIMGDAEHG